MVILRFETIGFMGRETGIYSKGLWQTRTHSIETGCPSPWDDKKLNHYFNILRNEHPKEYFYGFSSKEQLLKWFSDFKELKNIFDENVKGYLAIYKNIDPIKDDVISTEYQTVFVKRDHHQIEKITDFETFLEFITE